MYLERFPCTDCFVLSLNLDQYAARLNSVHIMTKVIILNKKNLEKIWKLIYMASHQKDKSGTKCWPTCLFNLGLQQSYLTEENLKMSYNLKVLPMKALEARSDTEWFGWIQS